VKPVVVGNAKLEHDVFEGARTEFNMKCFCIDSESATDIDDGVSIEPADKSGEYWIHIHVADPASRLRPNSPWAEQAAALSQTTYLQGHFARMFGDDGIRESFSLANDKPSLTFSGRVDEDGNLLEYKVTPAVLRDVTYITPEIVSDICGERAPEADIPKGSFTVGNHTKPTFPINRHMAKAPELSAADMEDLQTLSRLAATLHSRRLQKGAVPIYQPRASAEVSFSFVEVAQTPDGFMRCAGDPTINISYSGSSGSPLVSSVMQLAGEVAGRWCQERGIPIPYRVQPLAAQNADLIKDFTENVFYPKLQKGEKPSQEDWRKFMLLSGGTDISAVPAPNYMMGIDVYTKSTSPLRRYADLLVHWQIEAALLHEEQAGQSLMGNKDDSFLPFPRATLEEEILPLLRIRERHARVIDQNQGNTEWMLQALVRAWKFGEARLPDNFKFTVSQVLPKRLVRGTLDWFDRPAVLEPAGLAGVTMDGKKLTISDVRIGDVLEVGLEEVNVYEKSIVVKALGKA
jgi:exoribonuclease R